MKQDSYFIGLGFVMGLIKFVILMFPVKVFLCGLIVICSLLKHQDAYKTLRMLTDLSSTLEIIF